MRTFLISVLFLASFSKTASGQFTYRLDESIPVEKNGKLLTNPWAGGINSGQFSKIDLDGDGKEDLVVFERTTNKISTFLNKGGAWIYAPLYETFFPPEADQWLLLRDFNCDGKKDLFTHDVLGIAVYTNITPPGGRLKWRRFNSGDPAPGLPEFPLLTTGSSGTINLQTNSTDVIDISDIDGDGDLDILDAHFDGIGSLEFHKNMSVERTGKCDSMQMVRVSQAWGNFEECNCGEYLYGGNSCAVFGGREQHAAGKSILTIDVDNDGDRDLLFSEENCDSIYFLTNFGTRDSANFTSFGTFPPVHPIIGFHLFPATYFEDVDFDGIPDLTMSSNIYYRSSPTIDFANSVWYYKNTGSAALPNFAFVKSNFLQDQMIDVGDDATPAFIDEDGDGDFDLFVSSYNSPQTVSLVAFYENTGTPESPHFNFVTNDYAALSKYNFFGMKIQFADMDGDAKKDFVFTGTAAMTGATGLFFLANNSAQGVDISGGALVATGFSIAADENVLVTDLNQDGHNDLLVGRQTGALQSWINQSTTNMPGYVLQNAAFLGLGISTGRQNPAATAGDLDADGRPDLIVSSQTGTMTLYSDFLNLDDNAIGLDSILYDSGYGEYIAKNLGGRLWPVIVNIANTPYPAIAAGSEPGGIQFLKNDNPEKLPDNPVISILPNPATFDKKFTIRSDRNIVAQLLTVFGQKIGGNLIVTAHEDLLVEVPGLASGVYIVKFTYNGKTRGLRLIVP